jgi:hypothetical protein
LTCVRLLSYRMRRNTRAYPGNLLTAGRSEAVRAPYSQNIENSVVLRADIG